MLFLEPWFKLKPLGQPWAYVEKQFQDCILLFGVSILEGEMLVGNKRLPGSAFRLWSWRKRRELAAVCHALSSFTILRGWRPPAQAQAFGRAVSASEACEEYNILAGQPRKAKKARSTSGQHTSISLQANSYSSFSAFKEIAGWSWGPDLRRKRISFISNSSSKSGSARSLIYSPVGSHVWILGRALTALKAKNWYPYRAFLGCLHLAVNPSA